MSKVFITLAIGSPREITIITSNGADSLPVGALGAALDRVKNAYNHAILSAGERKAIELIGPEATGKLSDIEKAGYAAELTVREVLGTGKEVLHG